MFLRAFSKERPRWGWRRAAKALRRAGWRVNNKRVQRLWRDEGLKVPYRKRKKPIRGIGVRVGPMSLIAPNALWALDFQFDTTEDNRTLKLLNVVDEFTRECPAIVVERSIDADRVVATLDRLVVDAVPRPSSDSTMVPNSLPTPWPTGVVSTASARFSLTQARPGRTPGSNPSTAGSVTNCSTPGASTPCSRPRCSSRTGVSTTT